MADPEKCGAFVVTNDVANAVNKLSLSILLYDEDTCIALFTKSFFSAEFVLQIFWNGLSIRLKPWMIPLSQNQSCNRSGSSFRRCKVSRSHGLRCCSFTDLFFCYLPQFSKILIGITSLSSIYESPRRVGEVQAIQKFCAIVKQPSLTNQRTVSPPWYFSHNFKQMTVNFSQFSDFYPILDCWCQSSISVSLWLQVMILKTSHIKAFF